MHRRLDGRGQIQRLDALMVAKKKASVASNALLRRLVLANWACARTPSAPSRAMASRRCQHGELRGRLCLALVEVIAVIGSADGARHCPGLLLARLRLIKLKGQIDERLKRRAMRLAKSGGRPGPCARAR